MNLPHARGPLSSALFDALRADDPSRLPTAGDVPACADAVRDDDLQLALWSCYELHYRGFDDIADTWEWHPELIAFRSVLEGQFLQALRRDVEVPFDERPVPAQLWSLVQNDTGKSPSNYLQRHATRAEFREYVQHRSVYQLKEADPHTWAIPRLRGRAKAALIEIQMDEYGEGDLSRMHSTLFARVLRSLNVDDEYGAHVDASPGVTLALTNLISLFGLHRLFRGALAGHLAVFEMNSSEPSRRIARGLRRLGADDDTCAFYDVHVTADALHEQVAAYDLCGALATDEPTLAEDVMFGAGACLYVDALFAEHVLGHWGAGRSSLRGPAMPARLAG
ncbi:MAG: iron-containing redox enzyme family protein [bacterium]|nr:iron-containing redox enzyme family protein [bacterium]